MQIFMKSAATAIVLMLGLTPAIAADATNPAAIARMQLMKTIGANTKVLGGMAGGKIGFDAAAAAAAKAAIVAAAGEIDAKFAPKETDPASEAKPEIWTNWADFSAKGMALKTAAESLDPASLDGIKAGMGAIGGSCKACHSVYRM
ncbi:MAG: cytochrome c [Paracoccaceae bacterium]|jgi:cytochrome c556|nr:cytochrome c [Paracoccaceae bacterium]